jgi:hypothetical protein
MEFDIPSPPTIQLIGEHLAAQPTFPVGPPHAEQEELDAVRFEWTVMAAQERLRVQMETRGERPFAVFPNGAATLDMNSWQGIPMTEKDVFWYALGAANQAAPGWLAGMLAAGARMDTAIAFILRGIPPCPVYYGQHMPFFPAPPPPPPYQQGPLDLSCHPR